MSFYRLADDDYYCPRYGTEPAGHADDGGLTLEKSELALKISCTVLRILDAQYVAKKSTDSESANREGVCSA